ncbi:MAG TPA: protein kinase [Thermoanaerobaculia bacterium]|nr:protein kinase [Thermoanaerobaculia bacterium]
MRTLGKFEIIERLGVGGMGVVYRARDVELGRQVALKVLPEEVQTVPNRRVRFLHEARAVAALNHPAIATLYEFGEADDEKGESRLFLAMELVEGDDLQSLLASGPMTAARAVAVARQLAAGLEAAHRRGIIHRDLKPGNVRITAGGQVKILDFGLAKLAAPSSPDLPHDASVTREGLPMGTAPYMAPEQARGETVDARADLFSLGVILFEMLTGKRPFEARRFGEYLLALERGPSRSLREELPEADPRLVALVDRLLERKRSARYASAGEVVEQLARLEADLASFTHADPSIALETPGRPRPRPARRLAAPAVAVAAVALAVGALVVLPWLRGGDGERAGEPGGAARPAPVRTLRFAVAPFANLTGEASLDYLAQGVRGELSGQLTTLEEVTVVASSLVTAYVDQDDWHRQLHQVEKVDWILEGRLQGEGDVIRVTVDLVNARDGSQRRALAFQGMSGALLELQRAVATGVSDSLRSLLSPVSLDRLTRTPTDSNEAYASYLRGIQFASDSDFETASRYFAQATQLDPNFADAQAKLADAELAAYEQTRDLDRLARGMRAADRALSLDAASTSAKLARARGLRLSGRLAEADRLIRELGIEAGELAAELDAKTHLEVLLETAERERAAGRSEEATRILIEAAELAPSDWRAWHKLGTDSLLNGRLDEAANQLQTAIALSPGQPAPLNNLIAVYLRRGEEDLAIETVEAVEGPIPSASVLSNLGWVYYGRGQWQLAERYFRRAAQLRPTDETLLANHGDALAKLGLHDEARREHERALALVEARAVAFPEAPGTEIARIFYLAKAGRCEEAMAADARLDPSRQAGQSLIDLTKATALCGRTERALAYLERAAGFQGLLAELSAADELESLRDNESYLRLVAEVP